LLNPAEFLKTIPAITAALHEGRRITRQSLQKMASPAWRGAARKLSTKLAPNKLSVARLPVTGSDAFGREENIAFLDRAWAKKDVNVVLLFSLIPPGSGGETKNPTD
jgi:hypothetical protein